MDEWKWLESTRALQREAFDLDPDQDIGNPAAQALRVKDNVLAAMVELIELLNEVKWKYWSHEEAWVRRERILSEAVDVNHFVGNILVALGITDDEYERAYQAKQIVNRERQRVKYIAAQAKS